MRWAKLLLALTIEMGLKRLLYIIASVLPSLVRFGSKDESFMGFLLRYLAILRSYCLFC